MSLTLVAVERFEAARRAAMIAADVPALSALLSDDMLWVHGSSKCDGKEAFLELFASRSLQCLALDHHDVVVRIFGDSALVTGTLDMDLVVKGERAAAKNRFGALWTTLPDGVRLAYWQSTRVSS